MLVKATFKSGKSPEDLNSMYFLELIDIHHSPESPDESYVLNLKISHPLSNFNARTGGTSAAPGCRLDGEGLTYILQGGNMRLRLVAAMARLMAKPDRISARSLDLATTLETGPLNTKQLRLAKFAYDKGWYDVNKRIRISEMAEELKIARATLAEHLTRIESIVMDDLLGSFTNIRISSDEFEMFKDMAITDSEDSGYGEDEMFKKLLTNMHQNMEFETDPADDEELQE
ncbi:MAG: helix-turn-helix domain-containing protein [Candidatus Poseidoniaceae archaeon]